jgi:hypothetical protein
MARTETSAMLILTQPRNHGALRSNNSYRSRPTVKPVASLDCKRGALLRLALLSGPLFQSGEVDAHEISLAFLPG